MGLCCPIDDTWFRVLRSLSRVRSCPHTPVATLKWISSSQSSTTQRLVRESLIETPAIEMQKRSLYWALIISTSPFLSPKYYILLIYWPFSHSPGRGSSPFSEPSSSLRQAWPLRCWSQPHGACFHPVLQFLSSTAKVGQQQIQRYLELYSQSHQPLKNGTEMMCRRRAWFLMPCIFHFYSLSLKSRL